MIPRFVFPMALLLLVLVPISIYAGAKIRSLSGARKTITLILRTIILLCLVGALAGAEIVRQNDTLAVFFLLDQSNSIPEPVRIAAADSIRTISELYMEDDDEAGVIVFGSDSSIELKVDDTLTLGDIHSDVSGEQTDLASAIRLAMAAFPQGYMKRIVILSDGNETRGSALEEAKLAAASGVEVDVVPLLIESGAEVRIRDVSTPNTVNADEPFQVQIVVRSDQDTEATLRVSQRVRGGMRMLPEQKVILNKGDTTFTLPQELTGAGFYEYEATIESPTDTVQANNEGRAYAVVYGEPTVLYIEQDTVNSTYLGAALIDEGVNVVTADASEMPSSLDQLQNFDAVVMSDVSGTDLSTGQMRSIEAMVRDLGIGLIMVGGPNSYGAGGLHESPIERALPVNMDLKQRKVLPRGALALILHTCEIPDGNAWARDIGIASLNVLASQDLMGALAYTGGEEWLFQVQPVGDKTRMRSLLGQAGIGDMPSVGPTLQKAYEGLLKADAAVKRAIIISDGDPAAPSRALVNALKTASISVSTVCIAPHSLNDQNMLRWIADQTGGNYYFVNNPNNLPQIFTKEAAIVKQGLLIEEPFNPQPHHDSELSSRFVAEGFPPLQGYVATTPKDTATLALMSHEQDPVLAHWRFGLGKSVAFTSDVTARWASDWVAWDGFNSFWAQTVRWAMRDTQQSSFRVDTKVRDGKGHVRIDAVDDQGRFVNFLRPQARITGPAPDFASSTLSFMQTAPGIYEGDFPAEDRGVYMVNITYEDAEGNEGMIPAGLAVGYSREYEYNTTNRTLLEQVAQFGGGRILDARDNPFENNLATAPAVTPIWHWLILLAACLFPIEIFIRRVVVDLQPAYAAVAKAFHAIPGLGQFVRIPQLRPAPATGSFGSGQARQFTYDPASEGGAFGDGDHTGEGTMDGAVQAVGSAQANQSPAAAKKSGSSDYTRQLLAAKERALAKKQRQQTKADKENE
jgi:uncharacterized membrane protein